MFWSHTVSADMIKLKLAAQQRESGKLFRSIFGGRSSKGGDLARKSVPEGDFGGSQAALTNTLRAGYVLKGIAHGASSPRS
jgi:hypothetical protein